MCSLPAVDKASQSSQCYDMTTTRPPLSRNGMFLVGFGLAALIAFLIAIGLIVSGWFAPPTALEAAQGALKEAQAELTELAQDNQSLRSQLDSKSNDITRLEAEVGEFRTAAQKAAQEAQSAQAQVNVYVEKEQKVEFVVNRRQMEVEKLAREIHALEGVQVEIVDNGLIVSGVASPFSLGEYRIEEDALIPKLSQISEIFNAANREHSSKYYAAAVGNTDATPVKSWSGHHSNLWLGAKRARSLVDRMRSAGFPEKETFLISWGEIHSGDQQFRPEARNAQIYIVVREAFQADRIDAAGASGNENGH